MIDYVFIISSGLIKILSYTVSNKKTEIIVNPFSASLQAGLKHWCNYQISDSFLSVAAKGNVVNKFYYIHFEITGYPCNVIGSQRAIYSQIALSFALNRIFFSANENETVKQNNQSDFKVFLN